MHVYSIITNIFNLFSNFYYKLNLTVYINQLIIFDLGLAVMCTRKINKTLQMFPMLTISKGCNNQIFFLDHSCWTDLDLEGKKFRHWNVQTNLFHWRNFKWSIDEANTLQFRFSSLLTIFIHLFIQYILRLSLHFFPQNKLF